MTTPQYNFRTRTRKNRSAHAKARTAQSSNTPQGTHTHTPQRTHTHTHKARSAPPPSHTRPTTNFVRVKLENTYAYDNNDNHTHTHTNTHTRTHDMFGHHQQQQQQQQQHHLDRSPVIPFDLPPLLPSNRPVPAFSPNSFLHSDPPAFAQTHAPPSLSLSSQSHHSVVKVELKRAESTTSNASEDDEAFSTFNKGLFFTKHSTSSNAQANQSFRTCVFALLFVCVCVCVCVINVCVCVLFSLFFAR